MDGVRVRVLEWRGVWRIEWWSDDEEEEVNMVMGFCCSLCNCVLWVETERGEKVRGLRKEIG